MTASTPASKPTPEQPILWLGMSGFAPEQRPVLEESLTRSPGSPSWRTCAFGDADAWLVNGSKLRVMPDGNLKVAPGLPTERALNLNLSEVDRPVAFGLAVFMVFATILSHWEHGFFLSSAAGRGSGIEYTMALMLMALTITVGGAGALSVDILLSR